MEKDNQTDSTVEDAPKKGSPLDAISNIFKSADARSALAEVSELQSSLQTAADEFDRVKGELSGANQLVSSLEAEVSELKKEIESHQAIIAGLETKVVETKESVGHQAAQIAAENNADVTALPGQEQSDQVLSPLEQKYEEFKSETAPLKKARLARDIRELEAAL